MLKIYQRYLILTENVLDIDLLEESDKTEALNLQAWLETQINVIELVLKFLPTQFKQKEYEYKQNYITPQMAFEGGSDIIIVGRGIYESKNIQETAEQYREVGWNVYLNLIH